MNLQEALVDLFNGLDLTGDCLDDSYTLDPGASSSPQHEERDEILYQTYHATHYGYKWVRKGLAEIHFYKNEGFGASSGGPVVAIIKVNKKGLVK
jgi:hypothetical protein